MNRTLATITALVALTASAAFGGWAYAQGGGSRLTPSLTAQDHVEITQLYARFNQGTDFRNADLWLSTFADDAVFTLPNGRDIVGKDALTAWRSQSFGGNVGDSKAAAHAREYSARRNPRRWSPRDVRTGSSST